MERKSVKRLCRLLNSEHSIYADAPADIFPDPEWDYSPFVPPYDVVVDKKESLAFWDKIEITTPLLDFDEGVTPRPAGYWSPYSQYRRKTAGKKKQKKFHSV